ncbi:C-type lectin 37Db isoform X2 [Drosophila sulfurigaster albostrigata]|uniref:C-type lectin 37Db isoform X2 n=1 Tax=Drosophila sulfurigaster albostrigata TaxID=89887 RepID=UPI002D21DD11|nr:C-type lectin 37Db isoform X2 [Drosophila sulfurigaster albostrigata]
MIRLTLFNVLIVLITLASVDSGNNTPSPPHIVPVAIRNVPQGFQPTNNNNNSGNAIKRANVPIAPPQKSHKQATVAAFAKVTELAKEAPQGATTTPGRDKRDCPNCVDESQYMPNKWTMPLLKLGEKRYYLGIFFKANWFKATQYCRYHGMHLASISSQEENDRLEKHIRDFGLGHEHFWISGTDLADEGNYFWMATGRPITFTNWNAGEPNNFRYENGEEENCLELWNRDGKGLKWNDSPCSFETYFVCEVQPV